MPEAPQPCTRCVLQVLAFRGPRVYSSRRCIRVDNVPLWVLEVSLGQGYADIGRLPNYSNTGDRTARIRLDRRDSERRGYDLTRIQKILRSIRGHEKSFRLYKTVGTLLAELNSHTLTPEEFWKRYKWLQADFATIEWINEGKVGKFSPPREETPTSPRSTISRLSIEWWTMTPSLSVGTHQQSLMVCGRRSSRGTTWVPSTFHPPALSIRSLIPEGFTLSGAW